MQMTKGLTQQVRDSYGIDTVWLHHDFHTDPFFVKIPLFKKYIEYINKYQIKY